MSHFPISDSYNQDYRADCTRRKQNNYFNNDSFETQCELNNKRNDKHRRKTNMDKRVVVISNMDSNHDITTMVDQLLSKDDFSVTSSIFVAVPTSDDHDSDLSTDCSIISIQSFEQYRY